MPPGEAVPVPLRWALNPVEEWGGGSLCRPAPLTLQTVNQRLVGNEIHVCRWARLGGYIIFHLSGRLASESTAQVRVPTVLCGQGTGQAPKEGPGPQPQHGTETAQTRSPRSP